MTFLWLKGYKSLFFGKAAHDKNFLSAGGNLKTPKLGLKFAFSMETKSNRDQKLHPKKIILENPRGKVTSSLPFPYGENG